MSVDTKGVRTCGGGMVGFGPQLLRMKSIAEIARHVMRKITGTVVEVMPRYPAINLRSLLQLPLSGCISLSLITVENSTDLYVVNVCPCVPPFMRPVDVAEGYFHHFSPVRAQVELCRLPARVPDLRVTIGYSPLCVPKLPN